MTCKELEILKTIVKKHGMEDSLFIRGSASENKNMVPFWSDIDATFFVEKGNFETLKKVYSIKKEYDSLCKEIKLSVTVINESDKVSSNLNHHHGVKPLSYTIKLSKLHNLDIPDKISTKALVESSIYRYYGILYTFRREFVNTGKFTPQMVVRGLHRLSYFLRYQIEIMYPEILFKDFVLSERDFTDRLVSKDFAKAFFKKYDYIKDNWHKIRLDESEIQEIGKYLMNSFNLVHEEFLPKLKEIGVTN